MSAHPIDEECEDADEESEEMDQRLYRTHPLTHTPQANHCTFFYAPTKGLHGHFSNFSRSDVDTYQFTIQGLEDIAGGHWEKPPKEYSYSSAEQAIMHRKAILMGDYVTAKYIMQTSNPGKAKKFGRQVKGFDQDVWTDHAPLVAYAVLHAKFSQNPKMKKALLGTRNSILAEASPRDRIWGIGLSAAEAKRGVAWRGRNLLGRTLMRVRTNLAR